MPVSAARTVLSMPAAKAGRLLFFAWLVFALLPAHGRELSAPHVLEAEARALSASKSGRMKPVFLGQPGVVTETIAGDHGDSIRVALYDTAGVMVLRTSGEVWTARKRGGAWGDWREEKHPLSGECGTRQPEEAPDQADAIMERMAKAQDGATGGVPLVTIGFWYTAQTRAWAGGSHADVVADVALAMSDLQASLMNSGIAGQVSVTVIEQTDYDEGTTPATSSAHAALAWFAHTAAVRRAETASDLFHLLTIGQYDRQFNAAGVAQLFSARPDRAYAVSHNTHTAYGKETVVHEVGHNLGAQHSAENGCGIFGDNCGHYVAGHVRDVMTYWSTCRVCVDGHCQFPSCDVSMMFSAPERPFSDGGVDSSEPSGIAGQRNNARTVTFALPVVASYSALESVLPTPISIVSAAAFVRPLLDDERIFAGDFEHRP